MKTENNSAKWSHPPVMLFSQGTLSCANSLRSLVQPGAAASRSAKLHKLHIDFVACCSFQYHSLISVMEYLSVRSTAKIMLPVATECIKLLVISQCLYMGQINGQWRLPYSAPCGSSHVLSKPPYDSFICHTAEHTTICQGAVYEYIRKMIWKQ